MIEQTQRFLRRLANAPLFAWAGIFLCLLAIFFMGKPKFPTGQREIETEAIKVSGEPVASRAKLDAGSLAKAQSPSLSVDVTGFSDLQGDCLIAVYDDAASFNRIAQAVYRKTSEVTGDTVQVEFDDVREDSIAIAAFHDKNKNGILDKNAFGIPTERYGFSNNPVSTFGPPSFRTASVLDWKRASQSIKIQLKGLQ